MLQALAHHEYQTATDREQKKELQTAYNHTVRKDDRFPQRYSEVFKTAENMMDVSFFFQKIVKLKKFTWKWGWLKTREIASFLIEILTLQSLNIFACPVDGMVQVVHQKELGRTFWNHQDRMKRERKREREREKKREQKHERKRKHDKEKSPRLVTFSVQSERNRELEKQNTKCFRRL